MDSVVSRRFVLWAPTARESSPTLRLCHRMDFVFLDNDSEPPTCLTPPSTTLSNKTLGLRGRSRATGPKPQTISELSVEYGKQALGWFNQLTAVCLLCVEHMILVFANGFGPACSRESPHRPTPNSGKGSIRRLRLRKRRIVGIRCLGYSLRS